VVIKVAELLVDFPNVLEIDINPLLATPAGCTALDARIRIAKDGERAMPRA
jgi:acetyltransferase